MSSLNAPRLTSLASLWLAVLGGCAPQVPSSTSQPSAALTTPASASAASSAPPPSATVNIQILAFNDFHGHIEPAAGEGGAVRVPADDPAAASTEARKTDAGVAVVPVGGAATLAAHIERLRSTNPNTVVVSAGDLTGASPLISNLFHDEPTVLAMNALGLDYEGVGNHDFDRGLDELRRLQTGGCAGGDCDAGTFAGAKFHYLAANVLDTRTGHTVFPPYAVRELGGARIALIGETLVHTPSVTTKQAVAGLSFADEADTANALVPELQRQGVSAIVLLLHQGGMQAPGGTYDTCKGLSGDLLPVLQRLSPAIGVVVSGHTHQAYDCVIDGRLVTSAGDYGRLLTKIDLTVDPSAKKITAAHARNIPVTRDIVPDPTVASLVAAYEQRSHGVINKTVGWLKTDLTGSARRAGARSCETPLGDVIADAMRASTGADVAFMNPGGIRAELVAERPGRTPNAVTYGDAFEVQPFRNELVTMTLTGAQIHALLERQFGTRDEPRILQVSDGFKYQYEYDPKSRTGRVTGIRIAGKPLEPARTYRVTVPSFLAGGGDAFSVLTEGRDSQDGGIDVDALTAYLGKHSTQAAPMDRPKGGRIAGDGCR